MMHRPFAGVLTAAAALLFHAVPAFCETASAPEGPVSNGQVSNGQVSNWAEAKPSRARLVAGRTPGAPPGAFVAGVEIVMPPGWKTYWRSPGEAGGVPPEFDWTASRNLAEANVLYPAPEKFAGEEGATFGYHDRVVFPVQARAVEPDKPVELKLALRYGICKDICIPAEAELALVLSPGLEAGLPDGLAAALGRVPRTLPEARPDDPVLLESRLEAAGQERRLVIRARFPGGGKDAEAFLEGPGGAFLPPPERIAEAGEEITFAANIGTTGVLTVAGKTAVLTLAGAKGQSVSAIKLD